MRLTPSRGTSCYGERAGYEYFECLLVGWPEALGPWGSPTQCTDSSSESLIMPVGSTSPSLLTICFNYYSFNLYFECNMKLIWCTLS